MTERERELSRERNRRYNERHPGRVAELQRDRLNRDPVAREKHREATRRWQRENPEKSKAESKRYATAHRAELAAKQKAKRLADPATARAADRRSNIRRKYGLTVGEYETIIARGCAICGTHEKVCLDHDHTTGKVRDALCGYCNRAIGMLGDDPARTRAAADYLESHR